MSEDYVERATTFDGSEAPSGKRLDESESFTSYYRRLSLANSLDWNGKWKDRNRETQKNASAIIDAISGQLSLTDYQKDRAHRLFQELPSRFNKGWSTQLLALCICGIAGREDGRNYHPAYLRDRSENRFVQLAEELDVSYRALATCWYAIDREMK